LYVGDTTIESTEGGQQGAPLVPLLFALGIHDVISHMPACPSNFWYLDDGVIGGPMADAERALAHIVPRFKDLGCEINWAKTTVWGPGLPDGPTQQALPTCDFPWLRQTTVLPFARGSGTKILGVPVHAPGDSAYVRDCLEAIVAKQENACRTLSSLRDPQLAAASPASSLL
jgi:hypothetical protein